MRLHCGGCRPFRYPNTGACCGMRLNKSAPLLSCAIFLWPIAMQSISWSSWIKTWKRFRCLSLCARQTMSVCSSVFYPQAVPIYSSSLLTPTFWPNELFSIWNRPIEKQSAPGGLFAFLPLTRWRCSQAFKNNRRAGPFDRLPLHQNGADSAAGKSGTFFLWYQGAVSGYRATDTQQLPPGGEEHPHCRRSCVWPGGIWRCLKNFSGPRSAGKLESPIMPSLSPLCMNISHRRKKLPTGKPNLRL